MVKRIEISDETPAEQIVDLDRSNWIVIPEEFTKGKYKAYVDPARLAYSSAVEKAGKSLDINFKNTSKDSLGREFVGNNNWFQSLKLNKILGNSTQTLRQFNDFGRLLDQGRKGKIKVYYFSGKQVDSKFLENVFEDIYNVRNPWRGEFLDADFKKGDNGLYIHQNHVFNEQGNIVKFDSEILDKDTLMKDRIPGINLKNWLENPTSQGLPREDVKKGSLYYWHPRDDDNSVAWFIANSVSAILYCGRYSSVRSPGIGVRGLLLAKE